MKRIALFIITLFVCVVCYGATFNQYWYVEDNTPIQTSCTTGGDIILPTPPTKYGYDFIGWEQLPYVPIEYLESTGTQYIDTGFYPNQDTSIKVKLTPMSKDGSNSVFFGGANNTSVRYSFSNWGGSSAYYGGQNKTIQTTIVPGSVIKIDFNKNIYNFVVDETNQYSMNFTYTPFDIINALYIFNSNIPGYAYSTCMRLYYFQIYDNDVLVRDFIPVLDPDGVPCLYDKVEAKFYYNAGSGDFIAGPVIGE